MFQIKKSLTRLLVFIIIICLPSFYSCKTSRVDQQKKKVEKEKEKKDVATIKAYNKAVKRHQKIQSAETRKRMKSNLANANNTALKPKKQFFLIRWFTKKKKDTPCPASTGK
jgi:hypothetical protein